MSLNYKETLRLPQTDFPMKANLTAREPEILRRWQESDLYGQIQAARAGAPTYLLHDGPPFANGDVHMGTALNKVLKDLVVKSKTMAGFHAPFVPGWDCHGLPIEFKVVRETRGLSPVEVRRRSEEMARKFIDVQRRQFQRLGVFGDWQHPYLTLDPGYEATVLRAFGELVARGLVYQSKKPVYWSTGAQTALAEAEVEYHEKDSPAIHVKFPLVSGPLAGRGSVVIWTTTPWTLPANVAVAVHPEFRYGAADYRDPATGRTETLLVADGRREAFVRETGWEVVAPAAGAPAPGSWLGKEMERWRARHPFFDRDSLLILGDHVTLEAGTGCVHTAPGHGEEDFVVGRRYDLPVLSPVDDRGRFTEECGVPALVGKYVFDANPEVVELLRQHDALVAAGSVHHTYPYCWRSKTPIVFRAVEQFFVRMDDLRVDALRAIDTVNWLPPWGRNRIYGTVESRPDWCISRQRSWGVPLPVFYDAAGRPVLRADWIERLADLVERHGTNVWFDPDDQSVARELDLPAGTTRRPDTLDVWIDSGVSHAAVLRRRLGRDEPADLYLEATDQHRGWFQSSLVLSVALHGRSPYRTCLTHGFVVDATTRRKISKSEQGQYQKPTEAEHFVERYGSDVLRLWVSSVNFTDEVPFSEESFDRLTETYRRVRNTLRILLGNLAGFVPPAAGAGEGEAPAALPAGLPTVDAWVLHRLEELGTVCREAYAAFEFHRVYHALNQFCAVDLSSLYVDLTKDRLYCDAPDAPRRRATQQVMHRVFDALCRWLAPICVFTAEEAWGHFGRGAGSVHLERFPEPAPAWRQPAVAARVEGWLALRGQIGQEIERARKEKLIGNALEAQVTVVVADPARREALAADRAELEEFLILSDLRIEAGEADAVRLRPTAYAKCGRCWRHRPEVGADEAHPTLCGRCAAVVSALAP